LSEEDGRMHTSFHVVGTATGRLSSSDENMQNIPKFIGEHNIKKIFIPTDPDTQVIVNADAKAAEVRLYAAYSKDKNLIGALNNGMDPHSFFASKVYDPRIVLTGVPRELHKSTLGLIGIDEDHAWNYDDFDNMGKFKKLDPDYYARLNKLRTNIKRVVFGILYGAGKKTIANTAGIPIEQAQAIIDVLFRMFPTIPEYMHTTKDQIALLHMVETFVGRRRRFAIKNMTHYMKAKAERQAVNFKIQSTSSDIVLGVLTDIDKPLKELDSHLLITVHDSAVFEMPKKYLGQIEEFMEEYGVRRVAKKYPWLPVPFKWDTDVGPSYGELQSVDDYLENNPITDVDGDDYIELDIRQDLANFA
jgi:DNA polymerase-1